MSSLYRTPGPGQGSESLTPQAGGGMTPRGPVTPGLTPGRTPLRDKLNINSEEQLADPAYAKHMVNTHSLQNIWNLNINVRFQMLYKMLEVVNVTSQNRTCTTSNHKF